MRRKLGVLLAAVVLGGLLLFSGIDQLSGEESRDRESPLLEGDQFVFGKNVYEIEKVTAHADGTFTYRVVLR